MVTLCQSCRERSDVPREMDLVEAPLSKGTAFTTRSGQVCEVNHHLSFQTATEFFTRGSEIPVGDSHGRSAQSWMLENSAAAPVSQQDGHEDGLRRSDSHNRDNE